MKKSEEKPERKLQILVSETQRGTVIREKLGHILLWRKESDNRNRIYMVEIKKLICRSCGHLIELAMPKKIFKMMGEPSSHAETCDSCGKSNEYKFGEGQVKGIKV
jgi:RNase P subunit RPR2